MKQIIRLRNSTKLVENIPQSENKVLPILAASDTGMESTIFVL